MALKRTWMAVTVGLMLAASVGAQPYGMVRG